MKASQGYNLVGLLTLGLGIFGLVPKGEAFNIWAVCMIMATIWQASGRDFHFMHLPKKSGWGEAI